MYLDACLFINLCIWMHTHFLTYVTSNCYITEPPHSSSPILEHNLSLFIPLFACPNNYSDHRFFYYVSLKVSTSTLNYIIIWLICKKSNRTVMNACPAEQGRGRHGQNQRGGGWMTNWFWKATDNSRLDLHLLRLLGMHMSDNFSK